MPSLPRVPPTALLALPLSALLASLTAACGSVITSETSASTSGSGGAPTTASVSSSAASFMDTASSSSGVGGMGASGGSGGAVCGGIAGITCAPGAFCDFPNDNCGGADDLGVCTPSPDGCRPDCPGVCGCDGLFYCSACAAHAAGIDVSANASCVQPDGEYAAFLWLGGLDHMTVRKADPVRDVCVILYLDAPSQNTQGYDFTAPQDFGVSGAYITDNPADCASDMQPMGNLHGASGGQGVLTWNVQPGMYYPCKITIDASLAFPPGPPWANDVEVMNAIDVPVTGGCL